MDFYDKIISKKPFRHINKACAKYKEQILYVFFGCFTTLVNLLVYAALTKFLSVDPLVANAVAWIFAVLFAFVTNKRYVFTSSKSNSLLYQLLTFCLGRLFSLAVEEGIMYLFINILEFDDFIVKLVTQIIVIILNYLISKIIVFRKDKTR